MKMLLITFALSKIISIFVILIQYHSNFECVSTYIMTQIVKKFIKISYEDMIKWSLTPKWKI